MIAFDILITAQTFRQLQANYLVPQNLYPASQLAIRAILCSTSCVIARKPKFPCIGIFAINQQQNEGVDKIELT
jgi:hypothetical protein